jgi:hypothetical protein
MVGDRHRRHLVFLDPVDQVGNLDGAIKEAVLTVQMQVDEIGVFHENPERKNEKRKPLDTDYTDKI